GKIKEGQEERPSSETLLLIVPKSTHEVELFAYTRDIAQSLTERQWILRVLALELPSRQCFTGKTCQEIARQSQEITNEEKKVAENFSFFSSVGTDFPRHRIHSSQARLSLASPYKEPNVL